MEAVMAGKQTHRDENEKPGWGRFCCYRIPFKDTETESVDECINQLLINPIFQLKHTRKLALHDPESELASRIPLHFLLQVPIVTSLNHVL